MSLLQDRPPDRALIAQAGPVSAQAGPIFAQAGPVSAQAAPVGVPAGEVEAPGRSPDDSRGGVAVRRRPRAVREILLIAGLWVAYSLGRFAADGHVPEALANAGRVWSLERLLHLPDEAALQHALFHSELLVRTANTYYATIHFPATAAFLLWMYLRRPTHYRWARRALATLTATALVVHVLLPLAPPRMLTGAGLIDTAQRYGPSVYDSPDTDSVVNQYAAMPSLHVGWSLMVAIGLIVATRSRWRWLWLAHPAVTLLVVVGTANHYWLDGIVAGALLTAVLLILPTPARAAPARAADVTSARAFAANRCGRDEPGRAVLSGEVFDQPLDAPVTTVFHCPH